MSLRIILFLFISPIWGQYSYSYINRNRNQNNNYPNMVNVNSRNNFMETVNPEQQPVNNSINAEGIQQSVIPINTELRNNANVGRNEETQGRLNVNETKSQVGPSGRKFLHDRVVFKGTSNAQDVPKLNAMQNSPQAEFSPEASSVAENSGPNLMFSKTSLVITNLGVRLLKAVQSSPNIVLSPYSIATCLAVLQQAANGDTQYELSSALGMKPEETAVVYKELINLAKARAFKSKSIWRLATAIFTSQDGMILNPAFATLAKQNFDTELIPIDYGNAFLATIWINGWVRNHTQNRIDNLVSTDSITPGTQLILANAVFFKGVWKTIFDKSMTVSHSFKLTNGDVKPVQFMKMLNTFKAGVDNLGSQVVTLPFEGEEYAMMLILPSQSNNLQTVLNNLDETKLLSYLYLPKRDVKLMIPKFTARADTDLKVLLQKLGITKIFSQQADLSGLEASGRFSPKITSAKHTAIVSIDEQGGYAAAATSFAAVTLTSDDNTFYFTADRPFAAVLWDIENASPLFMMRIEDPSSKV